MKARNSVYCIPSEPLNEKLFAAFDTVRSKASPEIVSRFMKSSVGTSALLDSLTKMSGLSEALFSAANAV